MPSGERSAAFPFYLYDNLRRSFLGLRDGIACGRTDGDYRFPADEVVSRMQCRFRVEGSSVFVEDLSSTNGTRVNSVPVTAGGRRRLRLNDVIEFGTQRLILTHQNEYPPANIEDQDRDKPLYVATRNSAGELTSQLTTITQRTKIMMDRSSFQKLRMKEVFIVYPRRSMVRGIKTRSGFLSDPRRKKSGSRKLVIAGALALTLAVLAVGAALFAPGGLLKGLRAPAAQNATVGTTSATASQSRAVPQ